MADQERFLTHLRDSRLLGEQQVDDLCQRLTAGAPLNRVTSELVEQGWLTPFQIKRLWAGKGKGLVLGQYRILEELGQGGFGCVYKAQHAIMNRIVALKVIAPALIEDARARSWFLREVRTTTQLSHPNIVMAFDANEVEETLFLAMEYVEGPNLDQLVRKRGPLPIHLACATMHQVARALQYAHEQGMVHRDIKPANLLIPLGSPTLADDHGPRPLAPVTTPIVKIVDFGLARLQGRSKANTLHLQNEKSFLGTPDYVSPEQARNIHQVDIRSDLYSLGCTFYFALTGQRPFKGTTVLETVVQHLERDAEPLERYRPEIPPALASIVRRLMAKKPDHRFQTPDDLAAELGFLLGAALPPTAPALSSPPALAPLSGVRPTLGNLRPAPTPAHLVTPPTFQRLPPASSRGAGVSPACNENPEDELPNTACMLNAQLKAVEVCQNGAEPGLTATEVPAEMLSAAAPVVADAPHPEQEGLPSPGDRKVAEATSPVSTPVPQALEDGFREAWQTWITVVEGVVQGAELPIRDANYRAAHNQLLEMCRARAAEAGGDLFRRLESLLAPWLSLQVLHGTDRETLIDLVQRCCVFERDLGIRRASARRPWLWPVGIFVLLAACVVYWWQSSRPAAGRASFVDAPLRFVEANPLFALAVLVPLVVITSLYYFSRVFRS